MTAKRKYRSNLPPPEDTTVSGGADLLTPGFLRFVGELLFGERWQSPLAARLGEARSKKLSPATVHRWSMGLRSIPDWVGVGLAVILDDSQRDLERRARMAAALAMRVRSAAGGRAEPIGWAAKERGRATPSSARATA
jgi:hypothetical protein